jgi:hypothetical protein
MHPVILQLRRNTALGKYILHLGKALNIKTNTTIKIKVTRPWYLEQHPRWPGNCDKAVESMRISLNHVGLIVTVYRKRATVDLNQLHTGKNIHKTHDTKKISQISICKANNFQLAFQHTGVNRTTH